MTKNETIQSIKNSADFARDNIKSIDEQIAAELKKLAANVDELDMSYALDHLLSLKKDRAEAAENLHRCNREMTIVSQID